MSINQTLIALEIGGKIKRFVPRSRLPARRRLYLAGQAINDHENPQSAINVLGLGGCVRAAMTRWVLGERVYGKRHGEFLVRLQSPPPEVWEVRVTAPIPQVRLFGRFCEPDTLILTNFHTRNFLGPKGSQNWGVAMATCVTCWADVFDSVAPFVGITVGDYVTENCDAFPI
jgi:hypothetical protein